MKYKECREYIRADYYRFTGRKGDCMFRMWLRVHLESGFHFLFWWRLYHMKGIVSWFSRVMSRLIGLRYHICIERHTKIGYGFWLVHGGPVVINVSVKIGNNASVYQFSTIGSSNLHAT